MRYLGGHILHIGKGVLVQLTGTANSVQMEMQINGLYPQVTQDYSNYAEHKIHSMHQSPLGSAHISRVDTELVIATLFGYNGVELKETVDLPALKSSLLDMRMKLERAGLFNENIYFPSHMGCGNDNEKWEIVKNMIESLFPQGFIILKDDTQTYSIGQAIN